MFQMFNNNKGDNEMEARVSFSEEFRKKAEQGLSAMEKGKLRWGKLEEAEKDGTLGLAKTRYDIGNIVGLPNDASAYSWVSNLVNRGAIVETFAGTEDGIPIHSYRLGEKPSFDNRRKKHSNKKVSHKRGKRYSNGLSTRERGKIRYAKLRELDESGLLKHVANRKELIRALALSEPKKTVYSWVSNLKNQGYLIEELSSNMVDYKYRLAAKRPAYADEPLTKIPVEAPQVVLNEVEADTVVLSSPKATIEYGGVTVTMEQCEASFLVSLIKGLKSDA